MKKYFKLLPILTFLILNSCCSWNESSKKSYLTECEESRLSKGFCECSLEKLINKYACYEDAMQHEGELADIFIDCK